MTTTNCSTVLLGLISRSSLSHTLVSAPAAFPLPVIVGVKPALPNLLLILKAEDCETSSFEALPRTELSAEVVRHRCHQLLRVGLEMGPA